MTEAVERHDRQDFRILAAMTDLPQPHVIAINPGLCGALAVLSPDGGLVQLADLPLVRVGCDAWMDGVRLKEQLTAAAGGKPGRVVVERVEMSGQPLAFGVTVGLIVGIVQAWHLSLTMVESATWRRVLGVASDRAAFDLARELYPEADLAHGGRVGALLLARYAQAPPTAPKSQSHDATVEHAACAGPRAIPSGTCLAGGAA